MTLKQLLGTFKDKKILLLVGVLGLVLLLFGALGGKGEREESGLPEAEEYKDALEASLTLLCQQVSGVGEAQVFITLANTETAVYEKNENASGGSLATAGGSAVLLTYTFPKVAGVAVVCDGGGRADVKRELTSLLCASLSLDSHQVYIAPAK